MNKILALRLISYLIIFIFYISFMSKYSPLGIEWLDWHYQRIFNAVEYLRIHGYFNFYGFSIWTQCENCDLFSSNWKNKIYTSQTIFHLTPYIIVNHFFGKEALFVFGNIFDKTIIFITAFIISEIFFKIANKLYSIKKYLITIFCFSLFIFNPWVYKMFVSSWSEIYFLFYFLISITFLFYKKLGLGLIFLFFSGLTNHMWTFFIAIYLIMLILIPLINQKKNLLTEYSFIDESFLKYKYIFVLVLVFPTILFFSMSSLVNHAYGSLNGLPLLYRIGISGEDIHNGGILGALQFMGGNRITRCIENIDLNNLEQSIFSYNCLLSTIGMFFISAISIYGFTLVSKYFDEIKKNTLPLCFALLMAVCLLQQSLSAHLMGYSYVFGVIFSLGLSYLFLRLLNLFKEETLSILFLSPIAFAILLLCIRVNMLTGPNG